MLTLPVYGLVARRSRGDAAKRPPLQATPTENAERQAQGSRSLEALSYAVAVAVGTLHAMCAAARFGRNLFA